CHSATHAVISGRPSDLSRIPSQTPPIANNSAAPVMITMRLRFHRPILVLTLILNLVPIFILVLTLILNLVPIPILVLIFILAFILILVLILILEPIA